MQKLALRWHPDKVRGSDSVKANAESRFKEISKAYTVLPSSYLTIWLFSNC